MEDQEDIFTHGQENEEEESSSFLGRSDGSEGEYFSLCHSCLEVVDEAKASEGLVECRYCKLDAREYSVCLLFKHECCFAVCSRCDEEARCQVCGGSTNFGTLLNPISCRCYLCGTVVGLRQPYFSVCHLQLCHPTCTMAFVEYQLKHISLLKCEVKIYQEKAQDKLKLERKLEIIQQVLRAPSSSRSKTKRQ